MSYASNNIVSSSQSKSIPDIFNSFEQCNDALYGVHNIDLEQYCEITHQIQFDAELIEYIPDDKSKWLRNVLRTFIKYARYDVRAFVVPVTTMNMLGFNIDKYTSHLPKWLNGLLQRSDDTTARELRFLKKYHLKQDIDYSLVTGDIDCDILEHFITKSALYRLITKMYGAKFLESIILRTCQILYYFDDYKRVNRVRHIDALEATINKLSTDIASIRSQSPNILQFDNYESNVNNYFTDVDHVSYTPNENSNVKLMHRKNTNASEICHGRENDDIITIHSMIESSIHKVDNRLSEMHTQLASIMTKIDNMISSMDFNKRSSSISSSSSSRISFGSPDDDTMYVPRQYITNKQYSRSFINSQPTPRMSMARKTCIGTEHQF